MLNENFVLLGLLINLLGGAVYVKDTLQGKIQPNRVSWGIWAVAPFIAFAAEMHQDVGIQAWGTFMVGFTPLLIFISSFFNKKAYWRLGKFDFFCGALSVIGLVLWQITKIGNIAIFFSLFADFMAGIPTLYKAYYYPESENWLEFMSSFISMGIVLLTLKVWNFQNVAFPLYIFLFDLTAVVFIRFKFKKLLAVKNKI